MEPASRPTALFVLQQTRPLCQGMTLQQTEAFLRHQSEQLRREPCHASDIEKEATPILRFKLQDMGHSDDDDDDDDDDAEFDRARRAWGSSRDQSDSWSEYFCQKRA